MVPITGRKCLKYSSPKLQYLKTEDKINDLIDRSFASRKTDIGQSIRLAQEAVNQSGKKGFEPLRGKALSRLSLYQMMIGQYEAAYNAAQMGIAIAEKTGDETAIADIKYALAGFYYKTNDIQLGVVSLIDALSVYKKQGDHFNISRCEKALGSIYQFTGDDQKALHNYKNAIISAKKCSDPDLEANAYNNFSGIYLKSENTTLALELSQKAIAIKQLTGDRRGLAFSVYARGKVFMAQGNHALAEQDFLESVSIHLETEENFGLAMAYHKLGRLALEKGDLAMALSYAEKCEGLCTAYNIGIIKLKCLYLYYDLYKKQSDKEKALEYLEKFLAAKESLLHPQKVKVVETYDLLVKMEMLQKQSDSQQEKNLWIAKNHTIEQTSRIRQEFLSTMSHEIRTPLNAVTTIATLLHQQEDIKDKKLIDSLQFSAAHLMRIINDILDYTRLDLGKTTLDLHPLDLKAHLTNLVRTYALQAASKNIDMVFEMDENLCDTYITDDTKITQIVGNLLNNAVKFTEKGQVKLEVKCSKSGKKSDTISFRVSDTGIGIEKENLQRVFESFSQIKNGMTRKKDGAGLGLTITRKLLEVFKSEITVSSIFGKGSEFSFVLKIRKLADKPKTESPDTEVRKMVKTVLLAEDNTINALIAIKLLSQWDIVTEVAKNGMEATEKSQLKQYDFILMDIHMPVLDGFEAAKNIRTLKNKNAKTPMYALTADISAKENEGYSTYFDGFLLKPLEVEKLKAALSTQ